MTANISRIREKHIPYTCSTSGVLLSNERETTEVALLSDISYWVRISVQDPSSECFEKYELTIISGRICYFSRTPDTITIKVNY